MRKMAYVYRSLGKYYFAKLDLSEQTYALIDPRPLPDIRNNDINVIINSTLPGMSAGVVTSGRTIHINMGGGYQNLPPTMDFTYTDDTFNDMLESRRDDMTTFLFGWKTGETEILSVTYDVMCKYKVDFIKNGLRFAKPDYPNETVKVSLINLGYDGTFNELP